MENTQKSIAILGAGPAGLFAFKELVSSGRDGIAISIFERKKQLGAGMPYSTEGANPEHVTNVSDNEIPTLVTSISDWIKTAPKEILAPFNMVPEKFNEYKVVPRLLFGEYLSAQFVLLLEMAAEAGIEVTVHLATPALDIIDSQNSGSVCVITETGEFYFDHAIICTGHYWPKKHERHVPGYFDSPYPPSKLAQKLNHAVAIRGSSLTAIDAIRTLARSNGVFSEDKEGMLKYDLDKDSRGFEIMMHSRSGLLPAVRFHLEDSHLSNDALLTEEELSAHMAANEGFLSLDYIFEKDFKRLFMERNPDFYQEIKHMDIEAFVNHMMGLRESLDPFTLFLAEYRQAEKSIRRQESVYWKEMLAVLSFAMNYPAKHLSAEDMLRLKKVLMPLISIVIAFVPQSSCKELLALHDAGILDIVSVGSDSKIVPDAKGGIVYHYLDGKYAKQEIHYKTFIDCIGQPHLSYDDFPFEGLKNSKAIAPARLKFRSDSESLAAISNKNEEVVHSGDGYYLNVPGIGINDHFQVLDQYGAYNDRIYIMAVPFIGGFNPDYSGLDFCEAASAKIVKRMLGA